VEENLAWVCERDGEIVGIMLARLYPSVFDPGKLILFQDLLYVKKDVRRAAYLLLAKFIDFGKTRADHIFTAITDHTNIKGRSLAKLGFSKIQEQYRLVVK